MKIGIILQRRPFDPIVIDWIDNKTGEFVVSFQKKVSGLDGDEYEAKQHFSITQCRKGTDHTTVRSLFSMPDYNWRYHKQELFQANMCLTMALFIVTHDRPYEAMKVIDSLFDDNKDNLEHALAGAAALSTTLFQSFRENPFTTVTTPGPKGTITYPVRMINNISSLDERTFWEQLNFGKLLFNRFDLRIQSPFSYKKECQEFVVLKAFLSQIGVTISLNTEDDADIYILRQTDGGFHAYISEEALKVKEIERQNLINKKIKQDESEILRKQEINKKLVNKIEQILNKGGHSSDEIARMQTNLEKYKKNVEEGEKLQEELDKINGKKPQPKEQHNDPTSRDEQDDRQPLTLPEEIKLANGNIHYLMDLARKYHGSVTLGDLREGKTAIISEIGFIKSGNQMVEINTSSQLYTLPESYFPVDYSVQLDHPIHKVQIGFEAWLILSDVPVKDPHVKPYKLRRYNELGHFDLSTKEKMYQVSNGLTLIPSNVTSIENRYIEFFNKYAKLDTKLYICNDVYNEHRDAVKACLFSLYFEKQKSIDTISKYTAATPQWYKKLQFSSRYVIHLLPVPQYNESVVENLAKILNTKIAKTRTFKIAAWLINFFIGSDDNSLYLVDLLLEGEREFEETYKIRFLNAAQDLSTEIIRMALIIAQLFKRYAIDFIDYIKTIKFDMKLFKPKEIEGKLENQGDGVGALGTQTKSQFFHKIEEECYDLSQTNQKVLREMRFYDVHTKRPIGVLTSKQIIEKYSTLCTCAKNAPKKIVTDKLKNLPSELSFATYGNCPMNAICAIVMRQGGSNLHAEPTIVEDFKEFVQGSDVELVKKFKEALYQLDRQQYTFEAYIAKIAKVDKKKAQIYMQGRASAVSRMRIEREMKCFPKSGEWFIKSAREDVLGLSNRPRNICNPSSELLGVCNHINFILLACLKKAFPSYASYLPHEQLQDRIYTEARRVENEGEITCISSDFSSHDSNQHAELIECVDNYLIRELLPYIYPMLDLPQGLYDEVLLSITNLETILNYYVNIGKQRRKLFQAKLWGTVTSGHPTRTTFGNTLRVSLYYQYLFHKKGISQNRYSMFVGGDDFFAIVCKEDLEKIDEGVAELFSAKKYGLHGLGQSTRKVNRLGVNVDFLSKVGNISASYAYLHRQAPRIGVQQMYTDTDNTSWDSLQLALSCSLYCSGANLDYVDHLLDKLGNQHKNMDLYKLNVLMEKIKAVGTKKAMALENTIRQNFALPILGHEAKEMEHLRNTAAFGDLGGFDVHQIAMFLQGYKDQTYEQTILQVTRNQVTDRKFIQKETNMWATSLTIGGEQVGNISRVVEPRQTTSCYDSVKSEVSEYETLTHSAVAYHYEQILAPNNNNTTRTTLAVKQRASSQRKKGQSSKQSRFQQRRVRINNGKNSIISGEYNGQGFQLQQARKRDRGLSGGTIHDQAYIRSVLQPFKQTAVRGPSSFMNGTSLVSQVYESDLNFQAGYKFGVLALFPHHMWQQQTQNGPTWLNFLPTQNSLPPQMNIANIAGAGGFTKDSIMAYNGSGDFSNDTAKWMSARLVRLGLRLIPTGNALTKQGKLVVGQVPGKNNVQALSTNFNIPTLQALRNYPTSQEYACAAITGEGAQYVWLPLDPIDHMFIGGSNQIDTEVTNYYCRNPILVYFSGLNPSGESYLLQIAYTYEFVPTPAFEPWSTTAKSQVSQSNVDSMLAQLDSNELIEAASGMLGDLKSRVQSANQTLYQNKSFLHGAASIGASMLSAFV